MSEIPNYNVEGRSEVGNSFPSIGKIVGKTRDAAIFAITNPVTVGAAFGTLALPGYGTVIGALAGPVVHEMLKNKKES